VPMLQRMNQQEHPLQIENGICARHISRERRTSLGRRQPDDRRCHDKLQVLGPGPTQRERVLPLHLNNRVETTEERRRRVVGVPLRLCRRAKQYRIVQGARDPFEQPDPGNRRGSAATETGRHGNLTRHFDVDGRGAPARSPRDDLKRSLDRVVTPHRRITSHYLQPRAPIVDDVHDPGPQVQLNGNAEGIEATTQVGDRSRNDDILPDGRALASGLRRLK